MWLNSSRVVFVVDISELGNCTDALEEAANSGVPQLKLITAAVKLLLGTPWGLKFS